LRFFISIILTFFIGPVKGASIFFNYTPYTSNQDQTEFILMPFELEYFPSERLSLYFGILYDVDTFDYHERRPGKEGYKKRYRDVQTSETGLGLNFYLSRAPKFSLSLGAGYLYRYESEIILRGGWEEKERYLYERYSNYLETSIGLRYSLESYGLWLYGAHRRYGRERVYDLGLSMGFL